MQLFGGSKGCLLINWYCICQTCSLDQFTMLRTFNKFFISKWHFLMLKIKLKNILIMKRLKLAPNNEYQ